MLRSQKSKVFKTAWQIFKAGHAVNFSESLQKAWKICKISFGIFTNINFVKEETGEVRNANAVALGSMSTIENGFVRFVEIVNGASQWRSFKIANLQNF